MDSYTITITPNDESGNSTTLTVDTATGQARITSVHMHAPAGLTGAQLPSVDIGQLLQAVAGPAPAPAAITAPSTPRGEAATQPAPATADAGVDERRPPPRRWRRSPRPATPLHKHRSLRQRSARTVGPPRGPGPPRAQRQRRLARAAAVTSPLRRRRQRGRRRASRNLPQPPRRQLVAPNGYTARCRTTSLLCTGRPALPRRSPITTAYLATPHKAGSADTRSRMLPERTDHRAWESDGPLR